MSRRPIDKAGQNQQVIKNLLRLEANKMCADCKKNKHPRWASWNLGVFVCIRCSGIHRGMGTHISRVKSVDLDAWTDEQLQSIMKWGNARANRYWESKLAAGHIPSDAKIENFIRTKYESRRWVMEGPMPDPSTLGGDGDEDVPLSTVQDRARLDRSASQRAASGPSRAAQPVVRQAPAAPAPSFDLIGSDPVSVPPRANTTQPTPTARPPPANQPQQSGNLLGGLSDFLSGPPSRPTSTGSGPGGMSRPDLKQSILSLYASKPAAPAAPTQSPQAHQRQVSSAGSQGGGSFGGLNDAFGGLSFGSGSSTPASAAPNLASPAPQKPQFAPAPKPQAANPNAYAALTGVLNKPQQSMTSPPITSPLSGGGFFDAGSKPPTKPAAPIAKSNPAPPLTTQSATDDWGDFSMADNPPAPKPAAAPAAPVNKNAGLLDFTAGGASNFAPPVSSKPAPALDSVFNLSSKPAQPPQTTSSAAGLGNFPSDPWGSNEWATPDPAPAPAAAPKTQPISPKPAAAASNDFGWSGASDWGSSAPAPAPSKNPVFDDGGWGDPTPSAPASNGGLGSGFGASTAPKVQPEEDFGGWGASEPTPAPPAPQRQESSTKPVSTSEDLFGNVWG